MHLSVPLTGLVLRFASWRRKRSEKSQKQDMTTNDQQMADGDQPVQPGPVLPVDTPVDPPVTPVVPLAAAAETPSDCPSQLVVVVVVTV